MSGTTSGAGAHEVLRTWVRGAAGATPEEREALELVAGEGVVDDHDRGSRRHVTVIFEDDWNAAARELGRDVDPAGRRANVLLSGGSGRRLVGTTVRIGEATLEIVGETRPCHVMNEAAPGMQEALVPDMRAGVWGVIVEGGRVRRGDRLVTAD